MDTETRTYESLFKSLGGELRLSVLRTLIEGEKNVSEIVVALKRPQSNISHCLRRLESEGLIMSRQENKFRYYALTAGMLTPILKMVDAHFRSDTETIERMRQALQETDDRFRIAAFLHCDLIYESDSTTGRIKWFGDVNAFLGEGEDAGPKDAVSWVPRVHPDDFAQLVRDATDAAAKGGVLRTSYRMKKTDGTYTRLVVMARGLPEGSPLPKRWIGSVRFEEAS